MRHSEWDERWRTGRIGFHQSRVSTSLEAFADRVWKPGEMGRVLVPLCGKSLDMVFLAERADAVVGVEFVEQAVKEFFVERGLAPRIEQSPHARYVAAPYTVFAADIFALTPRDLGRVDAVFDRAALVALDAQTRVRYVDHLRSIMPRGARVLLITFDYDEAEMNGPPFSVPPSEVDSLFSDGFTIDRLARTDVLGDDFRDRGLSAMNETAFALTRT